GSKGGTGSVPGWGASASRPSDPVTRPVASLTVTRKTAATTLRNATRCCAVASLALRSALGGGGAAAAIAGRVGRRRSCTAPGGSRGLGADPSVGPAPPPGGAYAPAI